LEVKTKIQTIILKIKCS